MENFNSVECATGDHGVCFSKKCRCSCHNRSGDREPTKPKSPLDSMCVSVAP